MNIHKHDKQFLREHLAKLGPRNAVKAKEGYAMAWQEAFDGEPVEHRKFGTARRTANLRLLRYVNRITKGEQNDNL